MRCTDITARWCDRHGQCTCPEDGDGCFVIERDTTVPNPYATRAVLNPVCPLHGDASNHPIKR